MRNIQLLVNQDCVQKLQHEEKELSKAIREKVIEKHQFGKWIPEHFQVTEHPLEHSESHH